MATKVRALLPSLLLTLLVRAHQPMEVEVVLESILAVVVVEALALVEMVVENGSAVTRTVAVEEVLQQAG